MKSVNYTLNLVLVKNIQHPCFNSFNSQNIRQQLDKENFDCGISTDLQKAFDKLGHDSYKEIESLWH